MPIIHARIPLRVIVVLLLTAIGAQAAERPAATHYLDLRSPLQDKTFYVVSLLERTPGVAEALRGNASLAALFQKKRDSLREAAKCTNLPCFTAALRWSDDEIETAAQSLRELYAASAPVRRMVDGPLRGSRTYVRYESSTGAELLAQAWTDAARGMNRAIDIYGDGKPPRAPAADAPAFDVTAKPYENLVRTAVFLLVEQSEEMNLFFQPTLRFALQLLDINKRDEAARLEPMEKKENAGAAARIRTIQWSRYRYTVIVVPGSGPDRLAWNLSPSGKLRLEVAVRRWREKKAPLLLVSGGYVHPNQTPFSEAVEMKKALVEFGVPADAILIDPHARHTTTNLRNAARIMYRYGVPFDRVALITTDTYQSAGIESEAFARRCQNELGYLPYQALKRLSQFDLEWKPRIESLHIDPVGDLLDP